MSDKVRDFRSGRDKPRVASRGGGDGGGVDGQLRAIEVKLAQIEARMGHLATREDLQRVLNSHLKWGLGILAALLVLTIGAAIGVMIRL